LPGEGAEVKKFNILREVKVYLEKLTNEITNCHENIQRCRSSLFTLIVAAVVNVNIESVTIVDHSGTVQFVKLYYFVIMCIILSMKIWVECLESFHGFYPLLLSDAKCCSKIFPRILT